MRQAIKTYIDLPTVRYSFRADKVMKTDKGVAAAWDSNHEVRSITAVWGGRPFDAAIPLGKTCISSLVTLLQAAHETGHRQFWRELVVVNLRNALAVRTPIRGGLL